MRISGEIYDGNTGAPLSGVTLRVSKVEGAARVPNVISSRAGTFSLDDDNIMPETTVEFISNGYQEKSIRAEELQDEPVYLYSVMEEDDTPLEDGVDVPETTPVRQDIQETNWAPIALIAGAALVLFLMFRKKK